MGIQNFIDNLISLDYQFTDTELIQLKELCCNLHKLLDRIYSSRKSDVARRTYTSKITYEALQSRRLALPDEFYNFRYNDISVCIVNYHKYYYVKTFGFNPSHKDLQIVLDDKILSKVNLFTQEDYIKRFNREELQELVRLDSCLYGPFGIGDFDDCVTIFSTIIEMYLNKVNV